MYSVYVLGWTERTLLGLDKQGDIEGFRITVSKWQSNMPNQKKNYKKRKTYQNTPFAWYK